MIPYGRQSINDDDIAAVVQALKGNFLTTGPLVEQFEQEIEKVVGAPCVVVSSGTAALHCAYAAIGLEPGDEIITPPITFIATQATAALMGAKIVFADIQLDTGNIDPKAVEAAITPRTKAIVAVDYAGHPADLDELRAIADKHGVYLIEDAAHAIGSSYKNRPVGSIADITTFSFYPTKNLTTAEGGAVSSIHPELLQKARRFSRQGLIRNKEEFVNRTEGAWHQEVQQFGLNYRLPDVLCALGISQLSRLSDFKVQRSKLFNGYNSHFNELEGIVVPRVRDYVSPMWHLYHMHVAPEIRESLFNFLRQSEIFVQVNYIPAYAHPVFSSIETHQGEFINSEYFYKSEISLPMYVGLQDEEFAKILITISKYFG
ncbi:perosamine synthetase [Candidatus Planktophila dulcis]|uniref:DegT/DnrJ/EryC1/StrS family aminotransferase n=1 Tax=Candidatus Planktophila dulcis TaxID=1884914 RepID=UPI000BACCEA5|nr:aminotransferase class I/II-fold pyridoxal phosphate-dependent enzyme [Candidatus Planktophila dulcis]ASY20699.1 perosamine synthetase [Candidatus Planktophila dulcis]